MQCSILMGRVYMHTFQSSSSSTVITDSQLLSHVFPKQRQLIYTEPGTQWAWLQLHSTSQCWKIEFLPLHSHRVTLISTSCLYPTQECVLPRTSVVNISVLQEQTILPDVPERWACFIPRVSSPSSRGVSNCSVSLL